MECCSRCRLSCCFSVCRCWLIVGWVVFSCRVVVDRLLVLIMCRKVCSRFR